MRILLKPFQASIEWSYTSLVSYENRDHPVRDLTRHLRQQHPSFFSWGQFVAIDFRQFSERFDDEKGGWKPDWTTPIRVASLDLVLRLCRFIADLSRAKDKWMRLMILREASDAVVR